MLAEFLRKHFPDRKFENAEELAIQLLSDAYKIKAPGKVKQMFTANVFFNIGLGPQTKNLPDIEADTYEEAQTLARKSADKVIGEEKWIEVMVRPAR